MLRAAGITAAFKDLGAGGIMGCSAEIVASGGYGAEIDLDRASTSPPTVCRPQVIAVGETQERLMWVVPPSFTPELLRIYNEEFTLPEIARNARARGDRHGRDGADVRAAPSRRDRDGRRRSSFFTGSIRDELP